MRAAVVTVGCKNESLGAFKLAAWLCRSGWDVEHLTQLTPMFDGGFDLYAFSVVFSWRLPELVRQVCIAKTFGGEIWIGGPAVTFHHRNAQYVYEKTGVTPTVGLDERFESEQPRCGMTYFSRGCPAYTPACGVCPVPQIEGRIFRFYPDARPAKLLLDNNLSALPVAYQEHIIRRYANDWSGGLVDANSGFEPHSFDAQTLERWKRFPLRFWRFGYDDLSERDEALAMIDLLKTHGIEGSKIRVYCLIGNEPIDACHRRLRDVISAGANPWPQRLRPLDWLGGPLPTRFDWDVPTLIAYQRFYSFKGLWGRIHPEKFRYQGRSPLRAVRHLAGKGRT